MAFFIIKAITMYKRLNWLILITVIFFLLFIYKKINQYVYYLLHSESKEVKIERLSTNNKVLKETLNAKERIIKIEKKLNKLELNLTLNEDKDKKKLNKEIEIIRTIKPTIVINDIKHNNDKLLTAKIHKNTALENNATKETLDINKCLENSDRYRKSGMKTIIILNNIYRTIKKIK